MRLSPQKSETATIETRTFSSQSVFRRWLGKNSSRAEGIWLRFFKKDSGVKSITYAEALDEALCFGWIDGQARAFDADSWLQKFTPRRRRSSWSKRNTLIAERLIESDKMTAAGLEQVLAAKADGRWAAAYDSQRHAHPPDDFLQELKKDRAAEVFFSTLNKANIYAIVYRLQTAKKPETRGKRLRQILEMLSRSEKFQP